MKKSIARKELSRVIKNNKETVINDYHKFDFDKAAYAALENIFDDYEYAQDHGVYSDRDDAFVFLEVDAVIEELKERVSNDPDCSLEEKTLRDFLKEWKGYTIWL